MSADALQSVADVARAAFGAQAVSIAVLEPDLHEFVFAAVSGEGAADLVDARFSAATGVAGTVARTGRPAILDDVSRDHHHAVDIATETGYVPDAMMVAPVALDGRVVAVMSVLDAGTNATDTDLLAATARLAALALR